MMLNLEIKKFANNFLLSFLLFDKHTKNKKKRVLWMNNFDSQGMTAGQQNELRRLMIHAVLGTDM